MLSIEDMLDEAAAALDDVETPNRLHWVESWINEALAHESFMTPEESAQCHSLLARLRTERRNKAETVG